MISNEILLKILFISLIVLVMAILKTAYQKVTKNQEYKHSVKDSLPIFISFLIESKASSQPYFEQAITQHEKRLDLQWD